MNSAEVDMTNRNIHRYLAIDHITHNEAITLSAGTVGVPTAINGAWSVSPVKDASDNARAYTTLKLDNSGFTNYLYPPATPNQGETVDAATSRLFGNPIQIPWPISPL